ncbi:MAG: Na/Pi symporter, partial [Lachnospiraceae bacterium]|nr:Na/Pi symporter [Lachnospiraceae bacterium]
NIGTTITALLASVGQSRDAKRTAVAHSIFNISGALIFIWFVKPYAALIQMISPSGAEIDVISRQIANAHTVFNITMTLIWIGLLGVMVKIVTKLIPDGAETQLDLAKPRYLDKNVLNQPAAALRLVAQEVLNCSRMVQDMLTRVRGAVLPGDAQTLSEIRDHGDALNSLHIEIDEYLAELFFSGVLTEQQATQTARLMYVLSDIERMGDLSVEMADALLERGDKKHTYSQEALVELTQSLTSIEKMYSNALTALSAGDTVALDELLRHKDQVLDLDIEMRKSHMQRVNKGLCDKKMSVPFMRILHCIDRMGNSCVNLTEVALNEMNFSYFMGADTK